MKNTKAFLSWTGLKPHDHQLSRSVSALLSELLRQYSHLSSNPELYLKRNWQSRQCLPSRRSDPTMYRNMNNWFKEIKNFATLNGTHRSTSFQGQYYKTELLETWWSDSQCIEVGVAFLSTQIPLAREWTRALLPHPISKHTEQGTWGLSV